MVSMIQGEKYDLNVTNAQFCPQAILTFLDMPLLGDQNSLAKKESYVNFEAIKELMRNRKWIKTKKVQDRNGADYRNRTGDLLITSQLLYLLS